MDITHTTGLHSVSVSIETAVNTKVITNESNRPFYRYSGHIELIQFKEYYRMARGHEHIYFRALFGTFFLKVFLEYDCNGKTDPCAVFGCDNDRLFLV